MCNESECTLPRRQLTCSQVTITHALPFATLAFLRRAIGPITTSACLVRQLYTYLLFAFLCCTHYSIVRHFISLAWARRLLHSASHGWHSRTRSTSPSIVADHALYLYHEVPLLLLCHLNKGGEYMYILKFAKENPRIAIVAPSYYTNTCGTDLTPTPSKSALWLFLFGWSYNQIFRLTRQAPSRLLLSSFKRTLIT